VGGGDVQTESQQLCRASKDWLSCAYKSKIFRPVQNKRFVLHFGRHVLQTEPVKVISRILVLFEDRVGLSLHILQVGLFRIQIFLFNRSIIGLSKIESSHCPGLQNIMDRR
jgi:hypothetical protein